MKYLDNHCEPSKCCICNMEGRCLSLRDDLFVLAPKWEIENRLKYGEHYQVYETALMRKTLDDMEQEERETKEKDSIGKLINDYELSQWIKDEIEKARKQGLEEAWRIAGKVGLESLDGGYTRKELKSIFGNNANWMDILHYMSIHEVKEKIAAYEAEQAKPKLGDVVKCSRSSDDFQETGIIIIDGANTYTLLCQHDIKNYTVVLHKNDFFFEKTDKHFDIQSMLDEIG